MRRFHFLAVPALSAVLAVACSPASNTNDNVSNAAGAREESVVPLPSEDTAGAAGNEATPAPPPGASAAVIGLEGLGDLRIGQPVPGGGTWTEHGAQSSDTCRTVSSPDFPGVYAIVRGGKVRRITVGQRSDVKLVEGVGVGSSEKDVKAHFGGFREEPHKYVDAPAKYLTAPNAASGDPALRFEIGKDAKVSLFHVGTMPELGYVEGCS